MGAIAVAELEADIPQWFREEMVRLIGLQFVPASMLTHWQHLQGLRREAIHAGVTKAQGGTKFPPPWLLRTYAEASIVVAPDEDRSIALARPVTLGTLPTGTPIIATRLWRYYCEHCSDSGWVTHTCGGQSCGRTFEHGEHTYVRKCHCEADNPAIQKQKERLRQAVRTREERE